MEKLFKPLLYTMFVLLSSLLSLRGQTPVSPQITKCWEFKTDNLSNFNTASDNVSNFYLSTNNSSITALSETGKILWTTELGSEIISKIQIVDGKAIFLTKNPSQTKEIEVYAISTDTGLTIWKSQLEVSKTELTNPSIQHFGSNLLVEVENGILNVMNAQTGALLQKITAQNIKISDFVINKNSLFYVTKDKTLKQINLENYSQKQITKLNEQFTEIYQVNSNSLLLANALGKIALVQTDVGNIIWKGRVGGSLSSISELDNNLIVSSVDNYLYSIALRNGKIRWKKRLENRNSSSVERTSKFIFSSIINENKTVVVGSDTGKIDLQIILGDDEYFTQSPQITNQNILLTNNKGITLYTLKSCPK